MAFDGLDVRQYRALRRQQLMPHRHEMLGDDMQPRVGHEVMNIGDAASDRVFDRDHAEAGFAAADRGKGIFKGRARHRLIIRIDFARREVRIRSALSLENDLLGGGHDRSGTHADRPSQRALSRDPVGPDVCASSPWRCREDRARTIQVFGGVDAQRHAVDEGHIDAHSRLEGAQLLELFAPFQG